MLGYATVSHFDRCPFSPASRTRAGQRAMSEKCQEPTSVRLFDHHVGDPARFWCRFATRRDH